MLVIVVSAMLALQMVSRFPRREQRHLMQTWALQVFMTFANLFVIMVVYRGVADPQTFMRNGRGLADAFWVAPIDIGVEMVKLTLQMPYELPVQMSGGKGSTFTMFGLAGFGAIVLGPGLYGVHFAYSMISWFGKVGLYVLFREQVHPSQRWAAMLATCAVPSVVFWSAGIIKESIVISGLGMTAWGAAMLLKRNPNGLFPLLFGLYAISLIKPFILLAIAAGVAAQVYWSRAVARGRIDVRPISLATSAVLGLVGIVAVGYVFPKFSIANLGEEFAAAHAVGARDYGGSNYTVISAGTTSLTGQLFYAPLGLFTGWFRPTLLDVRNPQMLVNAIETTAFLYLFFDAGRRWAWNGFVARLVAHPMLAFALTFATVFGTGAGLASGNLGTLSRYRMPLVPFLAFAAIFLWLPLIAPKHAQQRQAKGRKKVRRVVRRVVRPSPRGEGIEA
ncbi:MAG: hypothetical protein H6736_16115 [Alphaproteobacteria bacterium]|nr:hypothetical protein [Alphaproteobacteria bacterium]